MAVNLNDDCLIDVFKFSDRQDINEHFEFVNVQWANCVAKTETAHLPLYKFYKLWICPLFCALHYKMKPTVDTILKEYFKNCSEHCRAKYMPLISDDWPAQRIPFCLYLQRTRFGQLKKITFNYDNWRVERNENGHFFLHFQQLCFQEAYVDVYNDASVTLFLLDCPILQLRTGHFSIRTTTDPLPFQRIAEFCQQKVLLTGNGKIVPVNGTSASQKSAQDEEEKLAIETENPIFRFALTGGANCSELTLEAHEFAMLFDLIEEYKYAANLSHAVPVVKLCVPPYVWHQRPFVEGTLCQMFHTSQNLTQTIHQFAFFDADSTFDKFTCNVHFQEDEPDKIRFYEFCVLKHT